MNGEAEKQALFVILSVRSKVWLFAGACAGLAGHRGGLVAEKLVKVLPS